MYFYLQEDATGADVNAVISIGDTLTVRSITDDSTGNKGKTALHAHVRADFQSPVAARSTHTAPHPPLPTFSRPAPRYRRLVSSRADPDADGGTRNGVCGTAISAVSWVSGYSLGSATS